MLVPAAKADFETEIAAEGGKWAKYYEQENLEGLMTLYVDDAVVALHGQPALFGIGAIRDYFSTRIGKAESIFEINLICLLIALISTFFSVYELA